MNTPEEKEINVVNAIVPTASTAAKLDFKAQLKEQMTDVFTDVPQEFTKPINWVMSHEGIRHVRHTKLANFVSSPATIPGLKSLPLGLQLLVPKVPYIYICQIMSFFAEVCKRDHTEASALIFFNPDTAEHFIHIPEQDNSGGGSDFRMDPLTDEYRKTMIPVMELHSHNTMGAFWSGTDNANEKVPMFYMVMGKLPANPEYLVRYSTGAEQLACDLFDIVEAPIMSTVLDLGDGTLITYPSTEKPFLSTGVDFPQEWMEKLKKPAITIVKGKNYRTPLYQQSNPYDDGGYGGYGTNPYYYGYNGKTVIPPEPDFPSDLDSIEEIDAIVSKHNAALEQAAKKKIKAETEEASKPKERSSLAQKVSMLRETMRLKQ